MSRNEEKTSKFEWIIKSPTENSNMCRRETSFHHEHTLFWLTKAELPVSKAQLYDTITPYGQSLKKYKPPRHERRIKAFRSFLRRENIKIGWFWIVTELTRSFPGAFRLGLPGLLKQSRLVYFRVLQEINWITPVEKFSKSPKVLT